jgi:hypothetical protein
MIMELFSLDFWDWNLIYDLEFRDSSMSNVGRFPALQQILQLPFSDLYIYIYIYSGWAPVVRCTEGLPKTSDGIKPENESRYVGKPAFYPAYCRMPKTYNRNNL